uniref:Secreted protein n=1 Tax=Panagrellus redivivus TaxID=6233 RepID=A0A7E4W5F8_PANRE
MAFGSGVVSYCKMRFHVYVVLFSLVTLSYCSVDNVDLKELRKQVTLLHSQLQLIQKLLHIEEKKALNQGCLHYGFVSNSSSSSSASNDSDSIVNTKQPDQVINDPTPSLPSDLVLPSQLPEYKNLTSAQILQKFLEQVRNIIVKKAPNIKNGSLLTLDNTLITTNYDKPEDVADAIKLDKILAVIKKLGRGKVHLLKLGNRLILVDDKRNKISKHTVFGQELANALNRS